MREGQIRTSHSHPIRVDQLPENEVAASGRLGMTFAPGMQADALGGYWQRDMATDMRALREEYGTDVLLSLMENEEYLYYGIPELLETERQAIEDPNVETNAGIEVIRYPIQDMGVPGEAESEEFSRFIGEVVEYLEAGKNVVAHCRGRAR